MSNNIHIRSGNKVILFLDNSRSADEYVLLRDAVLNERNEVKDALDNFIIHHTINFFAFSVTGSDDVFLVSTRTNVGERLENAIIDIQNLMLSRNKANESLSKWLDEQIEINRLSLRKLLLHVFFEYGDQESTFNRYVKGI